MKIITYSLVLSLLCLNLAQAQTTTQVKTVSMGAGYAQNVWYNLQTDAETKAPFYAWDLAVSVRGFDVAIHVHPLDTLYRAVNTVANFGTISAADTLPKSAARQLFNSEKQWEAGAMNAFSNTTFDYGWGVYSTVTNNVVGDSTYLIKTSTGVWKKLAITRLAFDTLYTIKYANLDGTSEQTVEINKKKFIGKNFAYLNLTTNVVADLEPLSTEWNLLFTRYQSIIPDQTGKLIPFLLTGVQSNTLLTSVRGVNSYTGTLVAKITRKDTVSDVYIGTPFSNFTNAIGADWKAFNYVTNVFDVSDSSTFFVKIPNGRVYKLIFKSFGGGTNGNFVFSKEYMLTTSVKDPNNGIAALAISPNPTTDGQIQVVFDLGKNVQQADFQLFNIAGQSVYNQKLSNTEGLQTMTLPVLGLNAGIYIGRVNYDGKAMIQKVVVR